MKNGLFHKLALLFIALVMGTAASAQVISPSDDDVIPDESKFYHHNRVVPYPHLREADILYKTRHWEKIDMREKMNHHMYYPIQPLPDRKSLWDVLVDGIMNDGTISEVFQDDGFTLPLTATELEKIIFRVDTIRDNDDPTIIVLIDTTKLKSPDVVAYYIKSDWFFDKQRGEMKNRILGLAPVVKDPKTQDEYAAFWVWFPDARYALATATVYNRNNAVQRMNFDQMFHQRFFSSVIYKENNVYDRTVAEYKRATPMDQLLESKRIRENLRNYENDMWEF